MKEGRDYTHGDLKTIAEISSAIECLDECLNNDRCKFFTWRRSTEGCHLKHARFNNLPNSDAVSGSKACALGSTFKPVLPAIVNFPIIFGELKGEHLKSEKISF